MATGAGLAAGGERRPAVRLASGVLAAIIRGNEEAKRLMLHVRCGDAWRRCCSYRGSLAPSART